jgi:hypothetical protein
VTCRKRLSPDAGAVEVRQRRSKEDARTGGARIAPCTTAAGTIVLAGGVAEMTANLRVNREAHRARWGVDPCAWMTAGRRPPVGAPTVRGDGGPGAPLQLCVPGGAWYDVHDPERPLDEARAWIGSVADAARRASAVCVIGAGAGWVIDALEELPGDVRMLVVEPEPAIGAVMLDRRDYRDLIEAGRLLVISGPEFDGAADAWRVLGRLAAEPPRLVHPVIAVARREETIAAARIAQKAISGALANERARRLFAAPYLLNTLRNVPAIARESDAGALAGLHRGAPIVVAGAGPSLNRNLEAFRPYRDRAVFIAADTALKPSLAAGLAPDFVVAVDPGAPNARHLTHLPPCDTALVAEPSVQSESLDAFAGRTFLFRVAAHQPWPWLGAAGVAMTTLRAWGSVVVTAFDLAVAMGGDPIVFIGADLAYTGDQTYCRGTVYEEDWALRVAQGEPIEEVWRRDMERRPIVTETLAGESIATAPHLTQFRDALLHAARTASARVVNATGAGILRGEAIEAATLEDIFARRPALPCRARPRRPLDPEVVANVRQAVRDLQSGAAVPDEWSSILAGHEPADPGLPAELSAIVARLFA